MKESPMLMSTENVKAILEGRKDQTRRTNGLDEINEQPDSWECSLLKSGVLACRQKLTYTGGYYFGDWIHIKCPYGQVGDRLWVRETFAYESPDGDRYVTVIPHETKILYHATDDWEGVRVPSIHMPRWASRITLGIIEIRVERLQEIVPGPLDRIKFADLCAEGWLIHVKKRVLPFGSLNEQGEAAQWYKELWDSLNAEYPWESNPFVWCITFKRV
jgi:hypothetical protein